MEETLANLPKRYPGLRVFSDDAQTRISYPVASDQIVFLRANEPTHRPLGELLEVVESTLGGKFQLPVETDPQKALEPTFGRTSRGSGPLATLEIWSLEPGCYDLVLKIPGRKNKLQIEPLVSRFVDQAKEVARLVDTTDLLRFQSGPALTFNEARRELSRLETQSGALLDTEGLMELIKSRPSHLLN